MMECSFITLTQERKRDTNQHEDEEEACYVPFNYQLQAFVIEMF